MVTMRLRPTSRRAALVYGAAFLLARAAAAEEVRVMTSGGTAAAFVALAPEFERATGHKVVTLATSTGLGADSISSRVRRGEPVDVIILSRAQIDELAGESKVVAASGVDLARSSIGMGVRKGAAKPDISTVDALKRALLQAKSVAYSAQVSGIYLTTELFPRLGIADQMTKKGIRVDVGRVGAVVARGEAEIGFQQISELMEVDGVDLVGPLPAEVQRVTVFTAAVAASSKSSGAARALIEFLTSPRGVEVMTKGGLDPIARR
jgi:molybdate transport system substrate-binding protein